MTQGHGILSIFSHDSSKSNLIRQEKWPSRISLPTATSVQTCKNGRCYSNENYTSKQRNVSSAMLVPSFN